MGIQHEECREGEEHREGDEVECAHPQHLSRHILPLFHVPFSCYAWHSISCGGIPEHHGRGHADDHERYPQDHEGLRNTHILQEEVGQRGEYHQRETEGPHHGACGETASVREPFLHAGYRARVDDTHADASGEAVCEIDKLRRVRSKERCCKYASGHQKAAQGRDGPGTESVLEVTSEEHPYNESGQHHRGYEGNVPGGSLQVSGNGSLEYSPHVDHSCAELDYHSRDQQGITFSWQWLVVLHDESSVV